MPINAVVPHELLEATTSPGLSALLRSDIAQFVAIATWEPERRIELMTYSLRGI